MKYYYFRGLPYSFKGCLFKKIKLYSYTSKELNVVNFEAIEKKIKKIKPKIIINASALVVLISVKKILIKLFQ